MLSVAVDLDDDRFDVRFDRALVDEPAILAEVKGLGYEPELVRSGGDTPPELERVDPELLPAGLREVFARARATGAPILLEFSAPG